MNSLKNAGMDKEVINLFLRALKLYKLPNEGIVCDYGDKGREFYIILEGQVDINVIDDEEHTLHLN